MLSIIRKAYIWTKMQTISIAGGAEGVALAGGRNQPYESVTCWLYSLQDLWSSISPVSLAMFF